MSVEVEHELEGEEPEFGEEISRRPSGWKAARVHGGRMMLDREEALDYIDRKLADGSLTVRYVCPLCSGPHSRAEHEEATAAPPPSAFEIAAQTAERRIAAEYRARRRRLGAPTVEGR